jgi:hypothetical protein
VKASRGSEVKNVLVELVSYVKGGGKIVLGEYSGNVPRKGELIDFYSMEGLRAFEVVSISWSITLGAEDVEDSCGAEIHVRAVEG